MSAPRFSIVVNGFILDQREDGTWWMTDRPQSFGCQTYEQVRDTLGVSIEPEPLQDAGYRMTGTMIGELMQGLAMQLPAYRATLKDMGGTMLPISNQGWCPDADEHLPHVQCWECQR